jgi:nucleotide-binding universal stress UspA family protein
MIKHKRILVPVTLAAAPDHGFDRALELARTSGAELYVLHAVPLHQPYGFRAELRTKRFRDLRERAVVAGVPVQIVEQQGDAADVIVLHADTRPIDLIVMTSTRRTRWERIRKSSVTESVVRRTIRPTLIVRPGETTGFSNVLVGIDLSSESAHIVGSAVGLAGSDLRELTVVHAVAQIEAANAVRSPGRWKVAEYRGYVLEEARRDMRVMMQGVETRAKVSLRVAGGSADEVIDAQSAAVDADLVVIGRSKRLLRFASTARRILRNTDHSLLVVPPPVVETRSTYKTAA